MESAGKAFFFRKKGKRWEKGLDKKQRNAILSDYQFPITTTYKKGTPYHDDQMPEVRLREPDGQHFLP
jgi:hypothetical protein